VVDVTLDEVVPNWKEIAVGKKADSVCLTALQSSLYEQAVTVTLPPPWRSRAGSRLIIAEGF